MLHLSDWWNNVMTIRKRDLYSCRKGKGTKTRVHTACILDSVSMTSSVHWSHWNRGGKFIVILEPIFAWPFICVCVCLIRLGWSETGDVHNGGARCSKRSVWSVFTSMWWSCSETQTLPTYSCSRSKLATVFPSSIKKKRFLVASCRIPVMMISTDALWTFLTNSHLYLHCTLNIYCTP